MFSGKSARPDGLKAHLNKLDIECEEWDTLIDKHKYDILNDGAYKKLMQRAKEGQFIAGVFGVPCSTYTIARIGAKEGDPRQIRNRLEEDGRQKNLSRKERAELDQADEILTRSRVGGWFHRVGWCVRGCESAGQNTPIVKLRQNRRTAFEG